nr:hypothetical protein KPHV_48130 [Kitasatospora purpeofusca]
MIEAGWNRLPNLPHDIIYVAPEHGLGRVSRSLPAPHHAWRNTDWSINGGRLNLGPRAGWHMTMSAGIPPQLLTAVTAALMDRTPVERALHSLADEHLPYLDVTTVRSDPPAATGRADAARTRTTSPAPAAAPAGAPTTTGPTGHRRAR